MLGKQMEKNGITKQMMSIQDGALKNIITYYTKEAGVRELERKIGDICRKSAKEILESREAQGEQEDTKEPKDLKVKVTASNLDKYLGKRKYSLEKANKEPQVGIVRGLAWTSVGGDTLQIEVNRMPGKGDIELTGQMGDVMKESVAAAITYIRTVARQYGISESFYKDRDIHIHFPEGAVPKDGPSAGITTCTALVSALSGIPVRHDVAMTGEITLRGRVLPIGGLKEKTMAAYKYGMKQVIIPAANLPDLAEVDPVVKEAIHFVPAETMETVLRTALLRYPQEAHPAPAPERDLAIPPVEGSKGQPVLRQ